tara:strand:+ start:752 stop:1126 length:375 start_codon:yes stop_codon:yes gene_type:complete
MVFVSDEIGFRYNCGAVLKVNKSVWALEMEFDFLRVKEMKDGDVVFPESKVLKGISKCLGICKKVGENYYKCALLNLFSDLVKSINKTSVARGLNVLEGIKNRLKLGSPTTRRNFEMNFFVAAA